MKRIYRIAGTMVMVAGLCTHGSAQTTSSGTGAGKEGPDGTFVGTYAGSQNTTGADNTFVGALSGMKNTGGSQNTALGSRSGYDNKQGEHNTFLGHFSGKGNQNGSWNTFVGSMAGSKNVNGELNTFLGYQAGQESFKGSQNIFVGYRTGYSNFGGERNVFLGNRAGEMNSLGFNNVFLGYSAGKSNFNGSSNTYLGFEADGNANISYATAIGAGAKVTKEHSIVLGTAFDYVGVGVSAPAYQLHLSNSSAAKLGSSSWTIWSDKRLKKDISDFTDGLDLLKQIKPVKFRYNGEAGTKSDKQFVGIIAQDMQKIAPYTIGSSMYQDSLGNKTEYLDYDANAVTYILINSVKEQQEVIDQKDKEIKEMSERIVQSEKVQQELIARLERLEKASPGIKLNDDPNAAARIEQNAPNGFSQNTSIKYYIPKDVKTAIINVYTLNGVKVGSHNIKERGEGELKLSAAQFTSGVHIYDLITDGKSNGSKKMLVK
ncbi:MAG: tail fiber domain-containing protein [Dyadobacter sp.]|uniref:tail fiber domain-containing protein n=1 Tax=Dyadobacter sp. TaxID=1914288 RepID=UPI00326384C5